MSEDEKELTKEERLEAARKKYEELKKKKKKSKKKAKKVDGEESPAPEDDQVDVNDENEELKEALVGDIEAEAVEEAEKSAKEAEEPAKEPVEDEESAKEATPEVSIAPSLASQEDVSNPPLATTNSTTQREVEELKHTIEQQKNTIKKLRDENTDLKLVKMDLDDKVAELEAQVAQLKTGAPVPVAAKKIEPAKPVITTNIYSDEATDLANFRNDDFREKLMLWKSWQVDMTQWKSPYSTPQVHF